jgi:pimeloyl-ACP methyl ester carboxylesterase
MKNIPSIGAVFLLSFAIAAGVPVGVEAQESDPGYRREAVGVETPDGQNRLSMLYTNGAPNPEWGCVIMHPAGDSRQAWQLPYFARAGIAALGMASRYLNNVEHEFYEPIVLDIAGGVKYLREKVGARRICILGHSGGGSLMTFYAHQSALPKGQRRKGAVSGNPVHWKLLGYPEDRDPGTAGSLYQIPDLNNYDLPPVDLMIVSAAHYGAGWALLRKIDPSVTDEDDPTSVDPSLDMYNPANGFKEPPASSKYSPEFLKRYKEAQEERAWRLVRKAQSIVDDKRFHAKIMERADFKSRPEYEQIQITRKAITQHVIVIYRLLAIPMFTDLSLEPNDREVGSNATMRPDIGNYSDYFHPSHITPESLLSAEGPTSPINLLEQIKDVTIPTLFISGTADMQEYPSEREAMFKASGAKLKDLVWIEGANHGYNPQGPKAGDGKQRDRAADAMIAFMRKAYPSGSASR